LNILFVLYYDFSASSAIHVHNFANLLVKNGNQCHVAVLRNKRRVSHYFSNEILYTPLEYEDDLPATVDIIHAWTPRESVRKYCLHVLEKFHNAKLIIHLEDNEELIVESYTDIPYKYLCELPEERVCHLLSDLTISPTKYKRFLAKADGITVITEELLDFIPQEKPYIRQWPLIDLDLFSPKVHGDLVRKELEIPPEQFVLCYIGSVHGVNAREVKSLYLAVYLANRCGIPTTLIRAGRDVVEFPGEGADELNQYVINLGYVAMDDVPNLMAAADLLVQPGQVDRFNRYRLPSKIPEFLATGKPVAIPETNIGLALRDGFNAIIMKEGNAETIYGAIKKITNSLDSGRAVGAKGREFAEENFSEQAVLDQLLHFYSEQLASS